MRCVVTRVVVTVMRAARRNLYVTKVDNRGEREKKRERKREKSVKGREI